MTTKHQGRGAVRPAALGLLPVVCLVLGVLLVVVAMNRQVPDPPRPASATSAVDAPAGRGGQTGPADRAGRETAAPVADAGKTAAPGTAARGTAAPEGTASTTGPQSATAPGADVGPETMAALPGAEPVSVRVDAIGVDSPLHALGLAADGTLEVPSGALVDQAAWYSGSPTPGESGPSVLEGHVTGPGGRPSVFFELGALVPGDRVEVDRADGSTVAFEVYRVDSYPKDAFPTVAVYGPTPGPELRLITCGGEFDTATGHHVDNTVVYARAVAADS